MNINISFVSETADGDIRGTTRTRLCLIDAYTDHLARLASATLVTGTLLSSLSLIIAEA